MICVGHVIYCRGLAWWEGGVRRLTREPYCWPWQYHTAFSRRTNEDESYFDLCHESHNLLGVFVRSKDCFGCFSLHARHLSSKPRPLPLRFPS